MAFPPASDETARHVPIADRALRDALDPVRAPLARRAASIAADGRGTGAAASDVSLFRSALAEAEQTFGFALSGDPTARLLAPMLHTAACHNLAVALAAAGEGNEARELRLRMVSDLVRHASSPACPLPLRINCVRHMRPAVGLLLSAAAADPELDIDALVARAQRVAWEVIRAAEGALGRGMVRASPDAPPADDLALRDAPARWRPADHRRSRIGP